jgi:hypothetical protein
MLDPYGSSLLAAGAGNAHLTTAGTYISEPDLHRSRIRGRVVLAVPNLKSARHEAVTVAESRECGSRVPLFDVAWSTPWRKARAPHFVEAARALLAEGVPAKTKLTMRHAEAASVEGRSTAMGLLYFTDALMLVASIAIGYNVIVGTVTRA